MVSILMATFNGEQFIADQLQSIFNQTYSDFKIYINDDGSTDSTLSIIERFINNYPEKIVLTINSVNSGGAKFNFFEMMKQHQDNYLMLCDQDDIWLPDKIEKSLKRVQQIERDYGIDTPILAHTDLTVVNSQLQTISRSFCKAMNADYSKTKLNNQLIQNTLTGCTAIYNMALAKLIYGEPMYFVMHDWWLMLIASAFGRIEAIQEQTILYRQHGDNQIGAKKVRTLGYKIYKLIHYQQIRQAIYETYLQAESFLCIYRKILSQEQVQLMETYCEIPKMNKWNRWRTVCRLNILKNGLARKIANFLFI